MKSEMNNIIKVMLILQATLLMKGVACNGPAIYHVLGDIVYLSPAFFADVFAVAGQTFSSKLAE
jgi:hypothetical protein